MYTPTSFQLYELVPPKVYEAYGFQAWQFLDQFALMSLQEVRDEMGIVTVNDWQWGGRRQWSGLRTADSPHYSPFSQHSFGRAFDCLIKGVSANDARQAIRDGQEHGKFQFITAIEVGVNWLHFDCRNVDALMEFAA